MYGSRSDLYLIGSRVVERSVSQRCFGLMMLGGWEPLRSLVLKGKRRLTSAGDGCSGSSGVPAHAAASGT